MLGRVISDYNLKQVYQVTTGKTANVGFLIQKKKGVQNPQNLALWIVDSNTASVDENAYSDAYVIPVNDGELIQITGILLSSETKILVKCPTTQNSTSVGSGDGTTTSFNATLDTLVVPGSVNVSFTVGGTSYTATDDGNGNISTTEVSGTIDYRTGNLSLTFTTAPDSGTSIDVSYQIYSEVLVTVTGAEV